METDNKKSYLERRVYEQMNIKPKDCQCLLYGNITPKNGAVIPIFSKDDKDNIDIMVYDLHRHIIEYEASEDGT